MEMCLCCRSSMSPDYLFIEEWLLWMDLQFLFFIFFFFSLHNGEINALRFPSRGATGFLWSNAASRSATFGADARHTVALLSSDDAIHLHFVRGVIKDAIFKSFFFFFLSHCKHRSSLSECHVTLFFFFWVHPFEICLKRPVEIHLALCRN